MVRTISGICLAGWLVVLSARADVASEVLAGTWKVTQLGRDSQTLWLVRLEAREGKWTGTVLDTAAGTIQVTFQDIQVQGDQVRFTLKGDSLTVRFEGKIPGKGAANVLGTIEVGKQLTLVQLEGTRLTTLTDSFEAAKEVLARRPNSLEAFDAAVELLGQAEAKKATLAEVRGWAATAFQNAAGYGVRWQREMGVRIAETLRDQPTFAAVALAHAQRAEKLLTPDDEATAHIRVLEALAGAWKSMNQAEKLREVEARIAKLEIQADREYLIKFPPLKPDKFPGRKNRRGRAVLVELFTGAECPPCVAADRAFDALEKTYQPTEVVLLEYHLHIPRPDPLANPDTEARAKYYEPATEGTPAILFNGKPGAKEGGPLGEGEAKYKEYRQIIDPLLETPARIKLKAGAVRQGARIDLRAEVSGLDEPIDRLRLRFVLVEEEVRYAGGNQVRLHHRVVRALPGGAAGLALKAKADPHTVQVHLDNLRKEWSRYLDEYAKENPFPSTRRPLNLTNLSAVVFVQNEDTKEVLQVVQVPIK